MANKEYAHSRIEHGVRQKDGSVKLVVIEENEVVPDGVFTDDELEALRSAKAVGDTPKTAQAQADALAAAQAEIDELKAQLAAAKKPAQPAQQEQKQ